MARLSAWAAAVCLFSPACADDIEPLGEGGGGGSGGSDETPPAECGDECPIATAERCDGGIIETCTRDADGCKQWVETGKGAQSYNGCVPCDRGAFSVLDSGYDSLTDLAGYTSLNGNLSAYGSDVQTLAPLACLTEVSGSVLISETFLTDLRGLDALASIGGDLVIGGCGCCGSCGGKGDIPGNDELLTLDGLGSLSLVGANLVIIHNAALPTCEAAQFRDRLLELDGLGGQATIQGNDDAGLCP